LLLARHPEAAASGELQAVLAKSALSVNEEIEYEHEKRELKDGDVVAVLPPVSGG
jgi:molybdopterin converting factor small subunit